MKKSLLPILTGLLICLIFLSTGTSSKATQVSQPGYSPEEYVANEVIVKFKEDVVGDLIQNKWLIQNVIDATQGKIKTYLGQEINTVNWDASVLSHRSFIGDPYLFHVRVPEYIGVDEAISFFKSIPYVTYAEKNYIRHMQSTFPNDPDFQAWDPDRGVNKQWALYNPQHNRCDIHAPEAWDIFTGSPDIVVAVIDTGIDLSHEDLVANIWTNLNDPAGGGDNDLNGFEDDVNGWHFSYTVGDNVLQDTDGHGTRMSGVIGGVGNNLLHMSGVCWNVKIMPIRITTGRGILQMPEIINAIDYALLNGANVINASFAGNNFSQAEEDAINRARGKNVLFIAGAGNYLQGYDTDDSPLYPSCYPLDNIISVLSTNYTDHKGYMSCYGDESVDLGAPGEPIWSTELGNAYGFGNGSSEATAHVTGVAALALGICPGLTSSRLRSLIINNVDDIAYLHGLCASGGRLNAYNVLQALGGSTTPSAPSNLSAYATAWNRIQLDWHDNSSNELGFEIQRKDQYQTYFIHHNAVDINSTSIVSFQDTPRIPQNADEVRTYNYRVRATNKAGISSFSNTASASVPYTLPAAPTDLVVQEAVYPNVHLDWADNANNELTFSLERRRHGAGPWSVIATIVPNGTSYVDSSVQIGSTYDYRVRTWNPIGYSGYSNVVTVEIENW